MNGIEIRTDADLQNCIYFQQRVEVWMSGEIEEIVMIADYNDEVIQIIRGDRYIRQNVILKVEK